MVCQVAAIFVLLVILTGLIPHYWFPSQYKLYLWLLAGLNILVAIALYFRMPESPRWLEARERRDQARQVMERMEARVMKRHPVLPEPDLAPHQVVAEERDQLAGAVRQAVRVRHHLAAGGHGPRLRRHHLRRREPGASCSCPSAAATAPASSSPWFPGPGCVSSAVYLLNAFFGDRFERRWVQLFGAILFAGGWWGVYEVHNTAALVTMYFVAGVGTILWLWSMYVYIPNNFPTRMRSLGTGWTDGIGHLGAWGGVLIAGQLFLATASRNFILFITIPCALVPGVLLAIFGKNQRRRALEELSR